MIPKFRAWDTKTNDWYDDKDQILVINLYGTEIINSWNGELMDDYTERIILLQSTGFKDKKGVDIYEGDYLSLIVFEADREYKGEVVFSKGSFCVVIQVKGHDCKMPLHEATEAYNLVEVLGNIYENPELLEVAE